MQIPLGHDDTFVLISPRWSELGLAWQVGVLIATLLVPALLIAWLYRTELRVLARRHAAALLALRMSVLTLLWSLVTLQPTLTHISADPQSSRVLIAVDVSRSMDVIDVQRDHDETAALAQGFHIDPTEVAAWSRKDMARRILSPQGLDLLRRLGERHHVELVTFDERRWAITAAAMEDWLRPGRADESTGDATDLRQALHGDSVAAVPLQAIILLTDGRHNRGPGPQRSAEELGALGIPVYPVALGSKRPPPDLIVQSVKGPSKAFKDGTVPITAQVKAMNLPAQELRVELRVGEQPIAAEHRQTVQHPGGDASYEIKFDVRLDQPGTQVVTIHAGASRPGEITLENNQCEHVVRVADERTRVLLVDAEARWEYHYLAAALGRDPSVELDRVLLAPPRLGLIKGDERDLAGLPRTRLPEAPSATDTPDPLHDYDAIILGDVTPDQLPIAERRRLERYVADRGGALLIVAGKRAMPMAFAHDAGAAADPLVKLLPIRNPAVFERKEGFTLRLTDVGSAASYLRLEPDGALPPWPDLRPHYWAIVGEPQPGATILATPADVPDREKAGLLVEQHYGLGQVVILGLDSTWRWRYRTGDVYHHRFWGQLLRWAAADRLLPAGNRSVRYGSREPIYSAGQPIELAARLGAGTPTLKQRDSARMRVIRLGPGHTEETAAVVPLRPSKQSARFLEGSPGALPAGMYRAELDIAELGNLAPDKAAKSLATFAVRGEDKSEMLDLSPNWELLQGLAVASGGRVFTPVEVDALLDALAQKVQPRQIRQDSKPWQDEPWVWWTLGLLLALLTCEWLWRKRLDLP
jgi:hypothetical protein